MATVYLAIDLKHDRLVALKVLRPELAAVLGAERFLREIRLTAQLQHPHILTLIDSGQANGFLYYVMPFVEGESLRERLERKGPLPLDEALRITRAVAAALDYAHQRGVIHRDIKPENILLHQGEPMVADFGIALAVSTAGRERLTETGLSLGTPAYMSPEQASAEPKLDGRTDQYSLACVVYEMLAGEPPYTGPTAQAIIAKRLSEPIPHLGTVRQVPLAVETSVTRALAKTPANRFPTATEFADALRPAPSTMPTVPVESAPLSRRKRQLAWIALGGAALLAGSVAVALLRHSRAELDVKRIVVAPFDNRTGDPSLDQVGLMAAEWLTQGLSGTELVEVVDSRSLRASVQAVRAAGGRGDPARALAAETRAGTIVSGSVYRIGDSLRFQAQVSDARSGNLRRAIDPVSAPAADPTLALEPLRQRVTGALATLLDARLNNQATATSRPPTYEAYQEFIRGMEEYGPTHARQDLAHFERAAVLDPAFTQALLWVGIAHADLGEFAAADSVFRLVEAGRDRLAPYDQANLDYFARGFVHGDWEGSYRGARRMLELAPAAEHAKWAVGLVALFMNRPREALTMMQRIDTARGWGRTWRPGILFVTARASHALGRYQYELELARGPLAQQPGSLGGRYVEARALAALGRYVEARALAALGRSAELNRLLDESLTLPADSEYSSGDLMYDAGLELRVHGHPEAARALFERAVAWYRNRPPPEATTPWHRATFAGALYVTGRWDEAKALLRALAAKDTTSRLSVEYVGALGAIAARQGDRAEAERIAARLEARQGPYLFGEPSAWRARIAAALGERQPAVALLQQALREGWPKGNQDVLHSDPFLEPLWDYPPFRELLRPKG